MDKENKASKKNETTEINYAKEKEKKGLSKERKKYKQKQKKEKILVCITQILVLIGFLALWEILADKKCKLTIKNKKTGYNFALTSGVDNFRAFQQSWKRVTSFI